MNGYTTSSCLYNLHHPIEPSKLPFNWIHILDSQIFFDALCICAPRPPRFSERYISCFNKNTFMKENQLNSNFS